MDALLSISISAPDESELASRGLSFDHVRHAYVELARQVLAAGGSLAYGGRPRNSQPNFVNILLALLRTYSKPDRPAAERIKLFLAAPNWRELTVGDRAELQALGSLTEIEPSPEGLAALDLTAMRAAMTEAADARVLLGGATSGYAGRWPGIIEEAYLALQASQPLYIAGGLGGAASLAADLVCGRERTDVELVDAVKLREAFEGAELNNGLADDENERLFETVDLDLIVGLILRGLSSLFPTRADAP